MTESKIRLELQQAVKNVPQIPHNRFAVRLINLIMALIPAHKAPQVITIKNIYTPK